MATLAESIPGFEQLAARHVVVDDPAPADMVLQTQTHLSPDPLLLNALRRSDGWLRYRSRTFVFDVAATHGVHSQDFT